MGADMKPGDPADKPLDAKADGAFGRQKGHAYPEGTEPEARALAALWLALEAEEEGA